MSDATDGSAYRVTLKDVDKKVDDLAKDTRDGMRSILDRLPDDAHARLRKVESQIAAQWVVVAIVVVALGGMFTAAITNTI